MAVHDNVDDFIAALETSNNTLGEAAENARNFLRVKSNLVALFQRIDAGLMLSPVAVEWLRTLLLEAQRQQYAFRWWKDAVNFERDDLYTDTRMHVMANAWQHGTVSPVRRSAALRQLRRMCDAGLTDISQFRGALRVGWDNVLFAGKDEFLLACDPAETAQLIMDINLARSSAAWAQGITGLSDSAFDRVAFMERKLVTGERLRAEFFRKRWLRVALSESEWAEVREMSVEILKELYPHVWDAGYESYRQAVSKGAVQHASNGG